MIWQALHHIVHGLHWLLREYTLFTVLVWGFVVYIIVASFAVSAFKRVRNKWSQNPYKAL